MKKIIIILFFQFAASVLFAQDVRLNDSVIFINDKPVALFYKDLNKSPLLYDLEVYSFADELLIKAEVIRFNAPVDELRPFFYYELSFPPIADTFAIYIEDEAFPLVLGKIIRDYHLIDNNRLSEKNVADFKARYYGGPALLAKIRSFQDYLDETRHFSEQAIRDRTKPVVIINDKIIMQDGVKIGLITENTNFKVSNQPASIAHDKSNYGIPVTTVTDQVIYSSAESQVLMASERKVELYEKTNYYYGKSRLKEETGKSLYEISKPANLAKGSHSDQLLIYVCFLIEEYYL